MIEGQETFLLDKQLLIESLSDDIALLLEKYIGKRIILKDSRQSLTAMKGTNSRQLTKVFEKSGTIVRIDPLIRNELIVMWHHDASSSNIKISELKNYELRDE
jgi:hypothetical protein